MLGLQTSPRAAGRLDTDITAITRSFRPRSKTASVPVPMESAKNEQPPSDAAVRRVSGQNGASTGSHLAPTSGEQARTRDADTDSSDSLCASAHSEDGAGPSDAETRTATVGEESVAEVKLPYHIALKLDSSLPSRDRYLYGRMGRVPAKDLLVRCEACAWSRASATRPCDDASSIHTCLFGASCIHACLLGASSTHTCLLMPQAFLSIQLSPTMTSLA